MEEIIIAYLVTTLNMTAEQVAELLYEKSDDEKAPKVVNKQALELLKAKDIDRVKALEANAIKGDAAKKKFDDGHKAGMEDAMKKMEKHLKETYGVESDKKGVELLDFAVSKVKADTSKESLTEDKVKIHPVFLDLEKAKNAEIKKLQDEKQAEIEKVTTEFTKKELTQQVRKKASEVFRSLNPILSANAEIAANQEALFVDALLNGYEFVHEGEQYIPMKEGKRLEDDHKNPLSLETFVKQTASKNFEFKKQDPKGNSGNSGSGAGAGDTVSIKDAADYNRQMNEAKTPQDRAKIFKVWEAQNQKA